MASCFTNYFQSNRYIEYFKKWFHINIRFVFSISVLDKNSDNDLNGIMSARSNFDADDLKTINYPEKDIDKLENDSR